MGGSKAVEEFDYDKALRGSPVALNVFKVLLSDLYQPASLGQIFDRVYNGEVFDPFHSPERVYGVIRNLRTQLQKRKIDVDWHLSGSKLIFNKPLILDMPRNIILKGKDESRVVEMRAVFKRSWFTSKQVREYFDVSSSSAERFLKLARQKYKVEQAGQGRAKRYRFG